MKPIYPIAAILTFAGLGAWLLLRPAPAANNPPAPSASVSTIAPQRQSLPRLIEVPGSIVAGAAEQNITLQAAARLSSFDVVPGQAVQAGQALAELAPDPAEAANLAKAQDAVQAARAARAHVASLLPVHLATTADLAAATQAERDAEAGLATLRATGAGQRFTLRAPAAGLVTTLAATPSDSLPAGTTLLKFVPTQALMAQAGLEQSQAAYLQPGDMARLVPLTGGQPVNAEITNVAASLDPQTGLIDVMLRPQAPVTLGAPVMVSIQAGMLDGILVPNAAVLRDAQGLYIYQLDTQNIAHRVAVTVFQQGAQDSVLASNGLNLAWKIATTGAYQLSDGMRASLQGAGS